MSDFERKFIADVEGGVRAEELTDEEKKTLNVNKAKKLEKVITMERDRTFSVSPDGVNTMVGDNELKPKIRKFF